MSSIENGIGRREIEKIYNSYLTGKNVQPWDIAIDHEGYPVIVATEYGNMNGGNQSLIYLRFNGEKWITTIIDKVGRHVGTQNDKRVFEYSAGSAINHNNTNEVYYSKQIQNCAWEIFKASSINGGSSFTTEQLTSTGKFNFRPVVVRNSNRNNDILYLQGDYSNWKKFDLNILLFTKPLNKCKIENVTRLFE